MNLEDIDKAIREVYTLEGLHFMMEKNREIAETLDEISDEMKHPDVPKSVRKFIRDWLNNS